MKEIKTEPREYQRKIYETASRANTLVVLPTGLGKCVEYSQPILFGDGTLMKIGEYFESALGKDNVVKKEENYVVIKPKKERMLVSLNDNLKFDNKKIIAIHKKKGGKLLRIITASGAEIVVTPEHPLLTLNKELEWKKTGKFKAGDSLAVPGFLPEPQRENKIDLLRVFSRINYNASCYVGMGGEDMKVRDLLRENISNNELMKKVEYFYVVGGKSDRTKFIPVWNISEDLFYWIGLVIAEGRVGGGIRFYNNDKRLLNRFSDISKRLFGIKPSKIEGGLKLGSTALFYFIRNLFDLNSNQHSRDKKISNLIMGSSNQYVKSFISALYDGEGSVRKDGLIEFITASKELASCLCYLLLRFGIRGRLTEKISSAKNSPSPKKRTYYRIYIQGIKDLERFRKFIGFKHEGKRKKLEEYLSRGLKHNPNFGLIPLDGLEVRKIREQLGLSSTKWKDFNIPGIDTYERNERKFSHETLGKALEGFGKVKTVDKNIISKINFFESLIDSDIYWDKIKKIEKIEDEWVYDISLEDNSNFVGGLNGGVIAHNTLIALMLAVERKKKFPLGKVLFLAPTRPLVEQHFESFKSNLPELWAEMELFTGGVNAEKRKRIFQTAEIIFSTPQCIANDVRKGLYKLDEVILLVLDECHRCLKNYDYTNVVREYKQQGKNVRILGLTASPGSDMAKVKEICKHLDVEEIEVRTRESEDVKDYLQELEFEKVEVPFPKEFMEIKVLLKRIFDGKVDELRRRNLLFGAGNKIDLLKLQGKLGMKYQNGRDFNAMKGMSLTASAIKISHAMELLETQTLSGLNDYLQGLIKQAREKKSRAVQNLVKEREFNAVMISLQELLTKKVEHPKVEECAVIVEGQFKKNDKSKVIIFTQFRDSAVVLTRRLNKVENVRANTFVGQAKKKDTGYSQKEQKEIIRKLNSGEINVLVATSIGEEGLDISEVSAVIFYEPIPSAIRKIQRAGRTARLKPGKLIILITKDTRDVAYHYASRAREKKMYKTIEDVRDDLKNGKKEVTLGDFK